MESTTKTALSTREEFTTIATGNVSSSANNGDTSAPTLTDSHAYKSMGHGRVTNTDQYTGDYVTTIKYDTKTVPTVGSEQGQYDTIRYPILP
jgi:hypothetical protein